MGEHTASNNRSGQEPPVISTRELESKVLAYRPHAKVEMIRAAFEYAEKAHEGQTRKSGEPYITHPLAVAHILAELRLDEASICTGILHDTVEDTDATVEDVAQRFGTDVSMLVDGVTKLAQIEFQTSEEKLAENFRKMLVAMSRDIRVLLVKLADRLHNMRTMQHMKPEKQERIAKETMDIYAPLANRLGISWVKMELEDLSFRYIDRDAYRSLADQLGKTKKERAEFIERVISMIQRQLADRHVAVEEVSGRPKHLWSIHKKMVSKKIPFEEVHDLIAFRVITDSIGTCYEVLGHIHAIWRPVLGRFKDYIAMPKPNGYRSLHTTVIGPNAERIEIQIRTEEMHHIAEEGIAAHWKYKESGSENVVDSTGDEFQWLKQLMNWQQELKDPSDFIDTVKFDLFSDEVFVFTPKGDVFELPRGATALDFAFAIHSDVGMKCMGAKVNGSMVSLKHRLESGDTCEVLTSPNQKPSKNWIDWVATSRARTKIRSYLRIEEQKQAEQAGAELIDKELRRRGASLNSARKKADIATFFKEGKYPSEKEILVAIGYGKLTAQMVADRWLPDLVKKEETKPLLERAGSFTKFFRRAPKPKSGISISGIGDLMVSYANCCSPLKGDPSIGFVSRGRGLVVHRSDCPQVQTLEPERRIPIDWDNSQDSKFDILVSVHTDDREGMLSDLSAVFSKNNVSITQANCRVLGPGQAVNNFHCLVADVGQLKDIMRALSRIKGVHAVERLREDRKSAENK